MATGPFSVNRISEATGIPFVTVDRLARVLKQHTPPMWARSVQGNGRASEHVTPSHLVNIALGLSISPITEAPEAIAWVRDLVPQTVNDSKPFLPGGTLGAALEGYIEHLTRAAIVVGESLQDFDYVEVNIHSFPNNWPNIVFLEAISKKPKPQKLECGYTVSSESVSMARGPAASAPPRIVYTIPARLLKLLAELWTDTVAQTAFDLASAAALDEEHAANEHTF